MPKVTRLGRKDHRALHSPQEGNWVEKSKCQSHGFSSRNPGVASVGPAERNVQFSRDISLLNFLVCSERDLQFGLQCIDYIVQLNPLPGGRGRGVNVTKTETDREMTSTQSAKMELKPLKVEIT